MAGREKKPAPLKRLILSPVPPKEGEQAAESSALKTNVITKIDTEIGAQSVPTLPTKQIKKTKPKTTLKKNLKINFKPKAKATKKLKLSKTLFKGNKINSDTKKVTLLKNGIKNKRIRKPKVSPTNDNKILQDDLLPPILERAIPLEPTVPVKKEPKKRVKKITNIEDASGSELSEKKPKLSAEKFEKSHEETVEDILNEVAHELDIDLDYLMKRPKKNVAKKNKIDASVKSESVVKPRKSTPKKLKTESTTTKLKKSIKKENLIDSFCNDITLDTAAQNVINNLDLNVTKTTRRKAVKKRRHSIEKIPTIEETPTDPAFEQPFVLFQSTRRSASPRTNKRTAKIRKSIETAIAKRLNPYTTRSDSPARILRNGKHRKLKDFQLLDGLDSEYKKRRRLCSEYSGSEISKYSGYLSESDSSFSDLASVQENGANDLESPSKEENLTKSDLLKKEIMESIKSQTPSSPEVSDLQNLNIKQISTKFTAILKRSLSTDTNQISESILNEDVKPKLDDIGVNSFTDTNSNDVKLQIKPEAYTNPITEDENKTEKVKCDSTEIKKEDANEIDEQQIAEKIASSPSEKVPDKSLILDSMKLTFNDITDEMEKRATRSSKRNLKLEEEREKLETVSPTKFYGHEVMPTTNTEENCEESEKIANSEITNLEEPVTEISSENDEKVVLEDVEINTNTLISNDNKLNSTAINDENKIDDVETLTDNNESVLEIIETESVEISEDVKMDVEENSNNVIVETPENSQISVIMIEEPKEESPVLVELNGEVHCEIKENVAENFNSLNGNNAESAESVPTIEETPENLAIKENILSALGLQSLRAAEEAKQRDKQKIINKPDAYTGTLKTVIKLNRQTDKKKRNPLKMTLQKSKSRSLKDGDGNKSDGANSKSDGEGSCYKVMKETGSSSGWRHGSHSSDTAGANRKSHYSNRSNMDGSSEHASDGDVPPQDGDSSGTKALVIPEKASSFGIHPDRLCSDECAYCFGKFGLFDTPLHIAQIKSEERQKKILQNEVYLTRDSCLCDACYRHVDRRINSNTATTTSFKNLKRNNVLSNLQRQNICHVIGCDIESSHVLRRKWLMKMRKSVLRVINIDLDNPGLNSIPICAGHYAAVEHLMVCALCKRRLARNHIHYLGFELNTLNTALEKEGIPVKLTDKPVVCKLCRYFATLLVKDSNDIKSNTANFFKQYKKRLLHFHDIEVMDDAEAEEPISVPLKEKSEKEVVKKKSKSKSSSKNSSKSTTSSSEITTSLNDQQPETDKPDQSRVPSNSENGESRESSPSDSVDIETLVPNMILECASDTEDNSKSEVPQSKSVFKKLQLPESVREAVEISKIIKINNSNRNKKSTVVERLGSNPSISVRQLFPGEEDLPLQGNIDFNAIKERTPEGWEKCTCTIQYDVDTKHLWQELQKPYGNQSSFLRHLILLEKYFRNGDLTLSPNASHHAVNYSVSVQNRLRAYDNIPTNSLPMQPLTMLPFNQVKKSQSGIITTKEPVTNLSTIVNAANLPKNTPIPISSLNPNFLTQLSVRQKSPGVPPGLISLQPGTNRPVAPLIKMPQKFKLPIGTKWRPTLIPVNPKGAPVNPTGDKRIAGLVQVISGGKPYHISIADYNRMCYLKKSSEMRQKVAEAKLKQREPEVSASSVLKPVIPRKPKVLSSTAVSTSQQQQPTIVNKAVTLSAVSKETSIPHLSVNDLKTSKINSQDVQGTSTKSLMILPKIPKSLTVIPQTVPRKPLQPSSPTLSITTKPSTSKS